MSQAGIKPRPAWGELTKNCRAIGREMGLTAEDHQKVLERARKKIHEEKEGER